MHLCHLKKKTLASIYNLHIFIQLLNQIIYSMHTLHQTNRQVELGLTPDFFAEMNSTTIRELHTGIENLLRNCKMPQIFKRKSANLITSKIKDSAKLL